MIAYQFFDCFSDVCKVIIIIHEGHYWRDDRLYDAFLSSFIVSCICAWPFMAVWSLVYQRNYWIIKETGTIFINVIALLLLLACFAKLALKRRYSVLHCLVYYIVPCSIVFDFWKLSLFVCSTLNLIIGGYTFFKAVYIWFKKEDSLPRKYNFKVSHVGCFAWCLFASPWLWVCFS